MKTANRNSQHGHALPVTVIALAAMTLTACSHLPGNHSPMAKATPAKLQQCESLVASFHSDKTVIDSAAKVAAGPVEPETPAVGEHCLVKGNMHSRQGADGQTYAIGFEMRLPVDWNGRFFYQANGGLDGSVKPATGALGGGPITGALAKGFAVISSDAGHTGKQTTAFGAEPQARLDYGYQAVAKLTPMAKSLIAAAYGKGPDRSYMGGCSNGGRHAMVAASRMGDAYDGYLVGAPGYRLPLSALAQIRAAQQWHALATPGATVPHPMAPNVKIPDLATALTPAERATVGQAVLNRCDALDGLKDGLVQDVQACQKAFDLKRDVPTCEQSRTGQCLTTEQKSVLSDVFAGVTTPKGQRVYAPFPWDSGIAGSNWAQWKLVNSLALDPLSAGSVFSVPPGRLNPITDDTDARLALFSATNDTYRESGLSLMMPPGQEKPTYMKRGARMVVYHGVSDAIFSAEDTRAWVDRANAEGAGDAVRFFPVPGMAHCSGGPSADQFDLLGPLVEWVEEGHTPQAVTASARGTGNAGPVNKELPPQWAPDRTRPLCAYPTVARYKGTGSPESAASFSCQ